ncbi:uncharacterized protein N7506_009318 [Penicillium brevicompactum]|uniref:uncharacterized protein n=1 Tax=Penicillium brevicompactum TaxID=5074 RepID=UPI00253FD5BA|nr:uncharacterized protein N7506_009318 [Penicillium brevicompactum]KAJ5326216.1 hypothetical protein N7506_009318 [Penicillium brevicompactum]
MQETTSSDVMVSPLWGNAFSELSGNSKVLAMILSFLDDERIDEDLLKFPAYNLKRSSLKFMKNNSE